MELKEWRSTLFEEIYPRHNLTQGTITWENHNHEDFLRITWNRNSHFVALESLYSEEHKEPLNDVLAWIYRNMPAVSNEQDDAYLTYNRFVQTYTGYILRPVNTVYVQYHVNPDKWFTANDRLSEKISCEISGSVLIFTSLDERLPVNAILSSPDKFIGMLADKIDVTDDLKIIISNKEEVKYFFVGHSDSIQRLALEYPQEALMEFTIGEWKNEMKKWNNHDAE